MRAGGQNTRNSLLEIPTSRIGSVATALFLGGSLLVFSFIYGNPLFNPMFLGDDHERLFHEMLDEGF
jgi:hypothetical protein